MELPDLNTEHPFVRSYFMKWIKNLIQKFKFDGQRIDTIQHVPHEFWKEFEESAGVFTVGEAFSFNYTHVFSY